MIMITLAVSTGLFYFAQQNYSVFNGHAGFRGVAPPRVLGLVWRDPLPFYYMTLFVAALVYCAVVYCARSTFGRALMATRDDQRRMRRLGYDVVLIASRPIFSAGSSRAPPAFFTSGSTAGFPRGRSVSARPSGFGHCRCRRPAPSHRPVHRRRPLCRHQDLRHRPCRRRSFQHAHWSCFSHHRIRVAGWNFRAMAPTCAHLAVKSLREISSSAKAKPGCGRF